MKTNINEIIDFSKNLCRKTFKDKDSYKFENYTIYFVAKTTKDNKLFYFVGSNDNSKFDVLIQFKKFNKLDYVAKAFFLTWALCYYDLAANHKQNNMQIDEYVFKALECRLLQINKHRFYQDYVNSFSNYNKQIQDRISAFSFLCKCGVPKDLDKYKNPINKDVEKLQLGSAILHAAKDAGVIDKFPEFPLLSDEEKEDADLQEGLENLKKKNESK